MSGFIGEFFGTMILIVLGTGCGAAINLNKSYAKGSTWLYVTIAWGMAVTFGVYVASFLGSQGHLNPAVTIGFATFGYFPWSEVLPYLAGQFLGAFVGAILVIIQYYPHFEATIVGVLIMVVGQALGGTTGFALNPARDWSPRLAYTILPVPNKGSANWGYAWVPMVGPIIGGILAAGLQTILGK